MHLLHLRTSSKRNTPASTSARLKRPCSRARGRASSTWWPSLTCTGRSWVTTWATRRKRKKENWEGRRGWERRSIIGTIRVRRSEIIPFSGHFSCFRAQGLPGERVERLGGLQQDLRDRRDGERLHNYRQQCIAMFYCDIRWGRGQWSSSQCTGAVTAHHSGTTSGAAAPGTANKVSGILSSSCRLRQTDTGLCSYSLLFRILQLVMAAMKDWDPRIPQLQSSLSKWDLLNLTQHSMHATYEKESIWHFSWLK